MRIRLLEASGLSDLGAALAFGNAFIDEQRKRGERALREGTGLTQLSRPGSLFGLCVAKTQKSPLGMLRPAATFSQSISIQCFISLFTTIVWCIQKLKAITRASIILIGVADISSQDLGPTYFVVSFYHN